MFDVYLILFIGHFPTGYVPNLALKSFIPVACRVLPFSEKILDQNEACHVEGGRYFTPVLWNRYGRILFRLKTIPYKNNAI